MPITKERLLAAHERINDTKTAERYRMLIDSLYPLSLHGLKSCAAEAFGQSLPPVERERLGLEMTLNPITPRTQEELDLLLGEVNRLSDRICRWHYRLHRIQSAAGISGLKTKTVKFMGIACEFHVVPMSFEEDGYLAITDSDYLKMYCERGRVVAAFKGMCQLAQAKLFNLASEEESPLPAKLSDISEENFKWGLIHDNETEIHLQLGNKHPELFEEQRKTFLFKKP